MKQDFLIITGANGQMGSYLAQYPGLKEYPKLLLYYKRSDRLQDIKDNEQHMKLSCDLMDADAISAALNAAKQHFGGNATRLIHAAAIRSSDSKSVAECDVEFFSHTIDVNLIGSLNIIKALLPEMKARAFGRIVLFTSVVTQTGLAYGAAYAAAKMAMVNLAKSIALENAADNILINCLSPGPIECDLETDYQGGYLKFRQDYFEAYKQKTPTRKLISKAELALLCNVLLSDELGNLTGQEIIINGGSL
ncbi:MAG TPA: SDR family oxidoreductase [Candidatus Cloacimonadota bacterium]|nr:SDR family oxidoreductase [Candidatus Cloacimonadota bacterium]